MASTSETSRTSGSDGYRTRESATPRAVVLIRLAVGFVFVTEGTQKFLYADALGAGRFAKIGIPLPTVMAPVVGCVELVCGLLVLIGFLTRPAALLLLIDILVAIISTKIPILLGRGFWGFANPSVAGFWSMTHEARTDLCMLLGSWYLLIVGPGALSADGLLTEERASRAEAAGAAKRGA
jgi:putative oxidoreductase